MRTTRLFVEQDLASGATVGLESAQSHYLHNVLRLGAGDAVHLFNGRDGEWRGKIDGVGRGWCSVSLAERVREQTSERDLWLAFAPVKRARIDFISAKATELGVTALYVTHDRDEAFAIADKVAVMRNGRFVRKGTPEEMWTDPQDEFVARMLGFDAIIPAKVGNGWADLGWVKVASDLEPGEHTLAIPPHAVAVNPEGAIEGRVLSATYRAGSYGLEIAIGETVLEASSPEGYARDQSINFDLVANQLLRINS